MDGLIATPIDMDGLIATPINSTDCAYTNVLDDTDDRLMMLICWSLLKYWWYGVNVIMLETMACSWKWGVEYLVCCQLK